MTVYLLALSTTLPVPLRAVERIVKTSGNLITSFLIQGGGFKFYQGAQQGTEGLILKAKLFGPLRFILKAQLENFRQTKQILWIIAPGFGIETGLVIQSLEINQHQNEKQREKNPLTGDSVDVAVFNFTLSFRKVVDTAPISRALLGAVFSALPMFSFFPGDSPLEGIGSLFDTINGPITAGTDQNLESSALLSSNSEAQTNSINLTDAEVDVETNGDIESVKSSTEDQTLTTVSIIGESKSPIENFSYTT
jgi:hypothetical protein